MEIVDVTEFSKEEQREFALEQWKGEGGIDQMQELLVLAKADAVPDEPRTITSTYQGETRAEALGRAYSLRDTLQEAGLDVEANLTDKAWKLPDTMLYQYELIINGGED